MLTAALFLAALARYPQSKIDHMVVLFMENRPFDHTFGCLKLPGSDYIEDGAVIPGSGGAAHFKCGNAPYACKVPPSYDMWAGKTAPVVGKPNTYPYSNQSDQWAFERGAVASSITSFGPQGNALPIKAAFAEHFAVFNKYFSSVPSYSTPNHLYAQSATSCGIDDNINYKECGGNTSSFPQKTIYDNLHASGVSFAIYSNHTPHSADTNMMGVARYKDRFLGYPDFFGAAYNGTLPALSWVTPGTDPRTGGSNSDHPCHDVALGERLQKDIYEALRAGPKWNKTLLLVTYDDAGGFYDHVVPPHEGVPDDESPCKLPYALTHGCKKKFDFRRLGTRLTSFLASPWLPKGIIIQEPKSKDATSQFEHSSISATLVELFGLSGFLTKRDAWAGSFGELLTEKEPRTDAPMHLPDAPPPTAGVHVHGCDHEDPDWYPEKVTRRQERHLELWSRYNGIPLPDYKGVRGGAKWTAEQAEAWIQAQYKVWRDAPVGSELLKDEI